MIITGRQAVLTAAVDQAIPVEAVIQAEEVHIRLRHIHHHSVQVHHTAVHQEEPEPEDIINRKKISFRADLYYAWAVMISMSFSKQSMSSFTVAQEQTNLIVVSWSPGSQISN